MLTVVLWLEGVPVFDFGVDAGLSKEGLDILSELIFTPSSIIWRPVNHLKLGFNVFSECS